MYSNRCNGYNLILVYIQNLYIRRCDDMNLDILNNLLSQLINIGNGSVNNGNGNV